MRESPYFTVFGTLPCCICCNSGAHWFGSPPLGATSASSPAAGPAITPSATIPAPRSSNGTACTPADGLPKVPRTYKGERSENKRKPLDSGVIFKSSCSVAKLAVPSM